MRYEIAAKERFGLRRTVATQQELVILWLRSNGSAKAGRPTGQGTFPWLRFHIAFNAYLSGNSSNSTRPKPPRADDFSLRTLAFSPDSRLLASGGQSRDNSGVLQIWDVSGLN